MWAFPAILHGECTGMEQLGGKILSQGVLFTSKFPPNPGGEDFLENVTPGFWSGYMYKEQLIYTGNSNDQYIAKSTKSDKNQLQYPQKTCKSWNLRDFSQEQ